MWMPDAVANTVHNLLKQNLCEIREFTKIENDSYSLRLYFPGYFYEGSCTILWCVRSLDQCKKRRIKSKYDRQSLDGYIPDEMHQAAVLISAIGSRFDAMKVTDSDLKGNVKTMRFERYCKCADRARRLFMGVELCWSPCPNRLDDWTS